MFIHTVVFWLRPDLPPAQVAQFDQGIRDLTQISTVRFAHVGTPAGTRRSVIDHSFSRLLVVGFADRAGHDVYQDAAVHELFRQTCGTFWQRVVIYDADAV
jgi:Stress responsive A/B Barrel Domain